MKKLIFIAVICVFIAGAAQADLTDYSIFGANEVKTGTYTQIHGLIGSGGNIYLGNSSKLFDGARAGGDFTSGTYINTPTGIDIIANNYIYLGNSSNVGGNVEAGGNIKSGTNVDVTGNVIAGGTVALGSGSTAGGITSLMVPAPSYTPPSLPAPTSFTAGGADQSVGNSGSLILAPGTYGKLSTGTYAKLYLSSGTYYFDAINTIGNSSQVYLDLTGGDIQIYVLGNFKSGTYVDLNLTGGSAKDIYIETHGDFYWGNSGEFYGTVFAPGGTVTLSESDISTGTYVDLYGAFYSDNVFYLGNSSVVNFEVADHFVQMVNPVPVPGAVLLGLLGLGAANIKLRKFA